MWQIDDFFVVLYSAHRKCFFTRDVLKIKQLHRIHQKDRLPVLMKMLFILQYIDKTFVK
jgi:hypothetical protein